MTSGKLQISHIIHTGLNAYQMPSSQFPKPLAKLLWSYGTFTGISNSPGKQNDQIMITIQSHQFPLHLQPSIHYGLSFPGAEEKAVDGKQICWKCLIPLHQFPLHQFFLYFYLDASLCIPKWKALEQRATIHTWIFSHSNGGYLFNPQAFGSKFGRRKKRILCTPSYGKEASSCFIS